MMKFDHLSGTREARAVLDEPVAYSSEFLSNGNAHATDAQVGLRDMLNQGLLQDDWSLCFRLHPT